MSVKLDYGPLNAEFQGGDKDEIQTNLIEFVEFLKENEEVLGSIDVSTDGAAGAEVPSDSNSNASDGAGDQGSNEHPLAPLAHHLGEPPETLEELIYVSVENEELPQLLVEDVDELGDSVVERQRNAALVLLLVWEECYGKSKMKTSDIKDVFSRMDISTSNTYRAWEKSSFKQRGQGSSATIQLRGPGEREAYSILRELLGDGS